MTPVDFAAALLGYCHATRGSVTSWIRSMGHNLDLKGHPLSYHLQALAADVVYDGLPPYDDAVILAGRMGLEVVRGWKRTGKPTGPTLYHSDPEPGHVFHHDHLEPLPRR